MPSISAMPSTRRQSHDVAFDEVIEDDETGTRALRQSDCLGGGGSFSAGLESGVAAERRLDQEPHVEVVLDHEQHPDVGPVSWAHRATGIV